MYGQARTPLRTCWVLVLVLLLLTVVTVSSVTVVTESVTVVIESVNNSFLLISVIDFEVIHYKMKKNEKFLIEQISHV